MLPVWDSTPRREGHLTSSSVPPDEVAEAARARWGAALQLALTRLEAPLKATQALHSQAWRDRVHAVHGVASWCKMNPPPPVALTSPDETQLWTTRPKLRRLRSTRGRKSLVTCRTSSLNRFGCFTNTRVCSSLRRLSFRSWQISLFRIS